MIQLHVDRCVYRGFTVNEHDLWPGFMSTREMEYMFAHAIVNIDVVVYRWQLCVYIGVVL